MEGIGRIKNFCSAYGLLFYFFACIGRIKNFKNFCSAYGLYSKLVCGLIQNIVDKTDQLNLQEDEKLQAKQELLNKRNRSLLSHYFKPTAEQDNEKKVPTTEGKP